MANIIIDSIGVIVSITIFIPFIVIILWATFKKEEKNEESIPFHTQFWEKHIVGNDINIFCEKHSLSTEIFFKELKKQEYFFIDNEDMPYRSFAKITKHKRIGYIGTKEGHNLCHCKEKQQQIEALKEEENQVKKYL